MKAAMKAVATNLQMTLSLSSSSPSSLSPSSRKKKKDIISHRNKKNSSQNNIGKDLDQKQGNGSSTNNTTGSCNENNVNNSYKNRSVDERTTTTTTTATGPISAGRIRQRQQPQAQQPSQDNERPQERQRQQPLLEKGTGEVVVEVVRSSEAEEEGIVNERDVVNDVSSFRRSSRCRFVAVPEEEEEPEQEPKREKHKDGDVPDSGGDCNDDDPGRYVLRPVHGTTGGRPQHEPQQHEDRPRAQNHLLHKDNMDPETDASSNNAQDLHRIQRLQEGEAGQGPIRDEVRNVCKRLQLNIQETHLHVQQLRFLALSSEPLTQSESNQLAHALRYNTCVEKIDLVLSVDEPHILHPILQFVLPIHPSLIVLDLGRNHLRNEQATLIGIALRTNTCLQRLMLYGNDIESEGIQSIANSLHINTTLEALDLSENKRIGFDGWESLGHALQSETCAIKELSLRECNLGRGNDCRGTNRDSDHSISSIIVGDDRHRHHRRRRGYYATQPGIVPIAEGVKYNASLIRLGLQENHLDDIGCSALTQALCENCTLEELYMENNPRITNVAIYNLIESLRRSNYVLGTLEIQRDQENLGADDVCIIDSFDLRLSDDEESSRDYTCESISLMGGGSSSSNNNNRLDPSLLKSIEYLCDRNRHAKRIFLNIHSKYSGIKHGEDTSCSPCCFCGFDICCCCDDDHVQDQDRNDRHRIALNKHDFFYEVDADIISASASVESSAGEGSMPTLSLLSMSSTTHNTSSYDDENNKNEEDCDNDDTSFTWNDDTKIDPPLFHF